MPPATSHRVFISYASGDKDVADQVCAALERRGISCWIAPRNARPGVNYGASIVDAIDESPVLVFVVSSHSISSPHVQREVERAANKGVHVIPFRIEDVPFSKTLQYFLEGVHWLDALTRPLDPHLDYLADTVGYFLSSRTAAGRVSGGLPDGAPVTGGPAEGRGGRAASNQALPEGAGTIDAPRPRPGAHRPQDALLGAIPSFSLDVLRAAVIGATAGAGLVALLALFTRDAGPVVSVAFILRVAALSGLIITAWLVGTSLPGRRAALLGALAGGLGGWMAESIVAQLWPLVAYLRLAGAWTVAGIVQWIAFGLAGGLIVDRTRTARPSIAVAIALVVASVARTLTLSWTLPDYAHRDFLLRNPLLFDLPVALGWGVSLVLCPITDASFRRPAGPHGTPDEA